MAQDPSNDISDNSPQTPLNQPKNRSELVNFIAAARSRGASDEFISSLLRNFGWPQREIERAYFVVYEEFVGMPIPAPSGGQGEAARDAFIYLLSFVTLGIWTQALGEIGFILINHVIPDPLSRSYGDSSFQVAFCLARLLVAYPVYLLLMRRILKDLSVYREKTYSGVRKWLTYIALLIVALVGIGTLMAFLTSFLRGELTPRFLLKVLVILVIDGSVLAYYYQWVQRRPAQI
ncbi:hypothetical protein D0962_30665 [Leptolyngbyaceae cyanobacterium CCMR0082]|uniref:DUF5671 domain-containing protein n=1 Tax=Adonisia turfae CCMR0082 TaxID=2304604 RepID=A0A6M0SF24_9CYAN|nr:DUF5671 domain-containing protein [Adonisia turfae]MDV3353236.1 DUF5671 domain-containing protein [Leptothoe sp. LEGE 181152]NEZ67065.1 hypothetical protein [Adonisia turfae CCMR0082]